MSDKNGRGGEILSAGFTELNSVLKTFELHFISID